MATPPFHYQPMFDLGPDKTEYYLLTKDYVSVSEFEGKPILKIEKEGLTAMANAAFRDVSFLLRRSHNEQVAKILNDPEASDNDKYVALTFLRNAEVSAKGKLPLCQDTGTAIIHGEKGQQVWTGYCDEEALSEGVYKTYTEENLRYSQNAPLNMYDEVNTKCNLPAQIDLEATEGMEYHFLCVTKGGGSANKTYLYQETKAVLNPATLVPFLVEKMKTLGTAACPPYHIAFVIGGTSAEKNLLTVKLASTHYYDELPIAVAGMHERVVWVTNTDVRSVMWNLKSKYWKKLTRLVWELSLAVNIWHTMFVSSVCPVTVLLVRSGSVYLALPIVTSNVRLIRTVSGLKRWMTNRVN